MISTHRIHFSPKRVSSLATSTTIKNKRMMAFVPRDQDLVLRSMNDKIQKAIEDAMACHNKHFDSTECAILWGEVEDLTKAVNDYLDTHPVPDPLDVLCENNPNAPECRQFDL